MQTCFFFTISSTMYDETILRYHHLVLFLRRPEKSSDGKFPLLVRISDDRQAVLSQKLIQLPLWHLLIITLCILWIMKWNLKAAWSVLRLVVIDLCLRLAHLIFIILMTFVVNGWIRRTMTEFDSHFINKKRFDYLTRKLARFNNDKKTRFNNVLRF